MATKEQREEWKRIGLCSKCGKNKAVGGGLTCQECRDKCKANRDYKRAHHLCVKCGRNHVAPNRKYCDECLEWRHNRYERDKKNQNYVDATRLKSKNRAQRNKENGLCTECGKPVFDNYTLCYGCLINIRNRMRRNRAFAKELKGE